MIMAGHARQKFVCYPIYSSYLDTGRSLTNWVAEMRLDGDRPLRREDWSRRADKADFPPAFAGWRCDWPDVPALIAAADEAFEYPMVDRDPVDRWSFSRLTLPGDAAYPIYPIGSNSASRTLFDADALARMLTEHEDPAEARRAYEAERLPPTAALEPAIRQHEPEQVMQLAEERAPQGFARIEDIAARYKQLARFDRERLAAMAGSDG